MRFYRIADARHAPEGGEGARLHGGRWNSPGRAVIYACETKSGALLEKLVHTSGHMPKHQVCVTFEAPDSLKISSLDPREIRGWDEADMIASRKAGDAWIEKAHSACSTSRASSLTSSAMSWSTLATLISGGSR
jgi:RES domain-containing protein